MYKYCLENFNKNFTRDLHEISRSKQNESDIFALAGSEIFQLDNHNRLRIMINASQGKSVLKFKQRDSVGVFYKIIIIIISR